MFRSLSINFNTEYLTAKEALHPKEEKIELEELAPPDFVTKKIATAELNDGVSLQKGSSQKKISEEDKGTMDDWVPRSDELIRLLGKHPMNAEPPLTKLVKEGTSNTIKQFANFK